MLQGSMSFWLEPLGESLQLSVFVMIIMILMEYFSLWKQNRDKKDKAEGKIKFPRARNSWRNIALGALLGCVPGCVGGFAAINFYTHGLWSFGAVISTSFSALGDDAFRMWGLMPRMYLFLTLGLCLSGFIIGWLVDRIPYFSKFTTTSEDHLHYHKTDTNTKTRFSLKLWGREWSLGKVLIVGAIMLYIYTLLVGGGHSAMVSSHEHTHHGMHLPEYLLENGLFIIISLLALYVVIISEEHFIQEHLYKHVLKEHFLSIFLWTLGTLYVIVIFKFYFGEFNVDGIFGGGIIFLVLAILIGWIPYSGPHFLFIQLMASSLIPFSVFFANALVQDGHTSLVLLSESRKQFIWLKGIKSILALVVGILGFGLGF